MPCRRLSSSFWSSNRPFLSHWLGPAPPARVRGSILCGRLPCSSIRHRCKTNTVLLFFLPYHFLLYADLFCNIHFVLSLGEVLHAGLSLIGSCPGAAVRHPAEKPPR